MSNDIKRAYFYAAATRPIFIEIPPEDRNEDDQGMVAQLNLSLYGTRDAAMNWADTYTRLLAPLGFEVGKASPCNFRHVARGISLTVHGDDFASTGTEAQLRWLDTRLREAYETKTKFLGPDAARGHEQTVRILNRIIQWTSDGISYEADQRHAEILIDELGLAGARGVTTPGSRDDVGKAAVENEKQQGEKLSPGETTKFRALCARLNYLALDRIDIQYASKEASRRMSAPQAGDWLLLKRIGRYLVKSPRLVQLFAWQRWTDKVEAYVDSDWAGCAATMRSTSGGVLMIGSHVVKSWSTTQATVALSSGEAELYALVKGASQSLGLLALASDMGHELQATVHSDSSAAIGITQRKGLGKLRHIRVQMLWVQDGLKRREFSLEKVDGADNVSDVLTKNVDAMTLMKHLASMNCMTMSGRAMGAPTLAMMHGIIMQVEGVLTIDKTDQLVVLLLRLATGPEGKRVT